MNQEHSVKTWHLLVILLLLPAAGWFSHKGVVDSQNVLDARRRYDQATRLMMDKDPEHAAHELEQCVAEAPDFAPAYRDLANAYFAVYHDRAVCIAVLRRGLMVMPNNGELHAEVGRMLFLHGDSPEAVRELELAKSLGAMDLDPLLDKARKADEPKAGD